MNVAELLKRTSHEFCMMNLKKILNEDVELYNCVRFEINPHTPSCRLDSLWDCQQISDLAESDGNVFCRRHSL